MIYTDRSRIVARNECQRLGYLGYEAGGRGWAPKATPMPLINGIVIHDALAKLLVGKATRMVVDDAMNDYLDALSRDGLPWTAEKDFLFKEQSCLIGGIIYTFAYHHLPKLLEEFDVATFPGTNRPWVEEEFTVEIAPGVSAMLRMDGVLRRKSSGELVILDFKTLSYLSGDWMEKWKHNAQTYLYTHALEVFSGEEVEGILYLGLIKGMRRSETGNVPWKGRKVQVSPYCYGYKGPTGELQLEYTSRKGFKKVCAWDEKNPLEWFEEVLKPAHWDNGLFDTLFCVVPPYAPVKWEVERWLRQVAWQEYLIAQYKEEIKDAQDRGDTAEADRLMEIYFPTNEERCFKYGMDNKCSFISMCFTRDPEPEALDFIQRTPHHESELEAA